MRIRRLRLPLCCPRSQYRGPGAPVVVVEQTKSNSKNNRRSFDSFRAQRETSFRMTEFLGQVNGSAIPPMRDKTAHGWGTRCCAGTDEKIRPLMPVKSSRG